MSRSSALWTAALVVLMLALGLLLLARHEQPTHGKVEAGPAATPSTFPPGIRFGGAAGGILVVDREIWSATRFENQESVLVLANTESGVTERVNVSTMVGIEIRARDPRFTQRLRKSGGRWEQTNLVF